MKQWEGEVGRARVKIHSHEGEGLCVAVWGGERWEAVPDGLGWWLVGGMVEQLLPERREGGFLQESSPQDGPTPPAPGSRRPALDPRVDYSVGRRPAVLGGECARCLHAPPLHEPTCVTLACAASALEAPGKLFDAKYQRDHLRDEERGVVELRVAGPDESAATYEWVSSTVGGICRRCGADSDDERAERPCESSPALRYATPLRGGCSTCGRSLGAHAPDGTCPTGGKVRVLDAGSGAQMWVERDTRTVPVPGSFNEHGGRQYTLTQHDERGAWILLRWSPLHGMSAGDWKPWRRLSMRASGERCFVERKGTIDADGRPLWHLVTVEEAP